MLHPSVQDDEFEVDPVVASGLTALGMADRDEIRGLLPVVEQNIDRILDDFYGAILALPDLAAFFQDSVALQRAKAAQRAHWLSLFSGRFDSDYIKSATSIGGAHFRIGLPAEFYMTAYGRIQSALLGAVARDMASRHMGSATFADDLARQQAVITTAVFIDMKLSLSVYYSERKRDLDTRHKKSAKALQDRFSAMLDCMSEPVCAINSRRHIIFTNRSSSELLGWSLEEILCEQWDDLVKISDQEGNILDFEDCAIAQTLQDGRPRHVSGHKFVRGDVVAIPIDYSVSPLIEAGQQSGAIIIFRDMTQKRLLEAQALKEQQDRDAATVRRRKGQPGEKPVYCQYEPRNPDAHECHHRFVGAAAQTDRRCVRGRDAG